MENHQHRRLLNNSVKNSDVKKQQQQQSGWGPATANSLSNKLLNRSSSGNENRCSFGASLAAAAAVGVHNPAPLVSRCSVECEEVEEEEEEEEQQQQQQEEKEKTEREVVVEEQGSSGLRSAWIQRIIPRVVGEENEKEREVRESAAQDSLVGFWKKKTASCVVADVGSVRVVAQRAREPNSSNERALDKQKEVQGGSGDGDDGVCSSSYLLGSRDELQQLGYQSWEDSAAAAAAAGGNRLLLRPDVISSAAHVRSNAGGGGVVVAAGLGLQFDGGGGGAARNFWVANNNNNNNNNNRSSSSNSSKETDMRNSCRFSTLPPLSPFVPFKHSKELHQSKSMDYQGNNSSSSGKLDEVAVAPLLTPWLLLPSYGVEQINAQQGKMAETVTWRMDNVPSLTPLYVPSKSSSLDSIDVSRLREKGLLGLGEMLSRPTDLTQVFSPFKSPQDANDKSPCSSKTASLPLELVLTMDPPNSIDSLKHEEDTGPKSIVQPEIDFEKCQQQAGSSANLFIAMSSPSSLWPEYENDSGNQEPSCHSRGDVEIFRQGSSSGQCLVDHESQHLKVQKVAVEDPGALGLLSDPPVSHVGGTPGCQSLLFQSASSCTPLNAVGERNTAVQGGCHNSAMQALQQDSTERRRGLSMMKESHGQELGPEDRDRGREHTRDDERKREGRERQSASEQLEGVARKDIDTEQVSSGSGAMEGWCGSSHGVHALGQGSRQGGDVWQRHNNRNLLIDALGDRSGGTSSWKSIRDPLMDSPSHVSSAEELPRARKVQTWLQRWMRPLTPGSNNSKCPQPLSISMVSSGSGLGTANQLVSDAYTSTGTESEEVVWYSRRVQITVSDETGLELERQRSHSVMDVNQFARTQRGNVFVGEDEGSRLKKSSFLGYSNHPSAAAMALVGAASRRSMPIPPQRPVKRVALTTGTANSPPGAGPPGNSPGLGGIHP